MTEKNKELSGYNKMEYRLYKKTRIGRFLSGEKFLEKHFDVSKLSDYEEYHIRDTIVAKRAAYIIIFFAVFAFSIVRQQDDSGLDDTLRFIRDQFYSQEIIERRMDAVLYTEAIFETDENGAILLDEDGEQVIANRAELLKNNSRKGDYKKDFDKYVLQLLFDDINKEIDPQYHFTNTIMSEEFEKMWRESIEKRNAAGYSEMKSETIGYMSLQTFNGENWLDNVKRDLDNVKSAKYLYLDLRGNPGGQTQNAFDFCDLFMDKDKKIIDFIQNGSVVETQMTKKDKAYSFEHIFILIDDDSQSASELVALSLSTSCDNVTLVGEKTHGKAIQQISGKMYTNYGVLNILSEDEDFYRFTDRELGYQFDDHLFRYNEIGIEPDIPSMAETVDELIDASFSKVIKTATDS